MAVDHPTITNVTEVYSSNDKDFNENEHHIGNDESNITKDTSTCNNEETHIQKHDEDTEENSRETVCCDILSNGENTSSNLENVPSNKVSNNPVAKNDYLNDKIDHSEASKTIEMRTDVKCLDHGGVNNISEKIPSRRYMTLVDSDSEEDITTYKTSNEFFAVDEDKYSVSPEHSQITKYKKNSKIIKNIKRLVDSESEDNEETSNIYNSSQIPPKTTDIIVNKYIKYIIT